jgi:hypothetical protein
MDFSPYWAFCDGLKLTPVLLPDGMNLLSPNLVRMTELAPQMTYFTLWQDGSFSMAFNPIDSSFHINAFRATCEISVPVMDDEEVGEDPVEKTTESLSVLPSPLCAVFAGGALGLGYSVTKLLS